MGRLIAQTGRGEIGGTLQFAVGTRRSGIITLRAVGDIFHG